MKNVKSATLFIIRDVYSLVFIYHGKSGDGSIDKVNFTIAIALFSFFFL